ncbi:MAG: hypothetical protein U0232_13645 [Thermomicrobiales bacterium]
MPFEIQIAVAKTNKYASSESGDTVELVERPTGGLSVVLVDGQGSGQAAKTISMMVSAKAVSLLKDGARDGAVARVVHDHLCTPSATGGSRRRWKSCRSISSRRRW